MALTDKQIEGVLAARRKWMRSPTSCPTTPSRIRRWLAQLDAVAKKNGFASYDGIHNRRRQISLVLGGFDPATKKYVGAEAVIKAQIAQVQADKKMSAEGQEGSARRTQRGVEDAAARDQNKANIDLVTKYYDKLAESLGGRSGVNGRSPRHKKAPEHAPGLFCSSARCDPASGSACASAS